MLKLVKNSYYELDFLKLKELIREHLIHNDDIFDNEYVHNGTWYVTTLSLEKDDQIIDAEMINELLTSDEFSCERIDHAIWLLIMKDILPEGDYLVSICW